MTLKAFELRKNFYWTGIVDADLKVFDIIMYTEFGTTYNSYVLKAGDKTVLFETAKVKFFDEYLDKLREITEIDKIDYLVASHTEPDHAGSIEKLLEINPGLKILATGCALGFLKEIINGDFTGIAVKDNETMKIGDKTLRFMAVPNLHWPDTMYTYIEEEQILVTCDSFGAHYAFPEILSSRVTQREDYLRAAKYYFDCILGPFKTFMKEALDRVRRMDVTMICTGHGPVLDDKLEQIYGLYDEWCSTENPNPGKTVIIPYVSAYGYTAELAGRIAKGVGDSGEVAVRCYDLVEADSAKVLEELGYADGILFGTPTILGEALKPIWELLISMYPATHRGKLASAFGSYGWSGEGVPHVMERLKQLRMRTVDGFRIRFKPSPSDLIDAYDFGYSFGCELQNKENSRKPGRSRLVKCLVCGAIFDSALDICPVCGVGRIQFVPVEEEENLFRRDSKDFYVILGNGAAGISAAEAIRERDKTGSIIMVSNEIYSSYNRPMLTKSIMAELNAGQIAVHETSWYEENSIFQILGREVACVDTKEKEVCLDDGMKLKYTKLIYALGSECIIPPVKGADRSNVFAVRRLDDIRKIADLLPQTKRAVVIGGGVLGLEAAWELKKSKCRVTVLEAAPVIMGRQLDEPAADLLRIISEGQDVEIRTGAKVTALEGDGFVSGVRLEGGTVIPADMVIFSCGIRANVAVAKAAGLECARSVVVNEKMETSAEGVYACGDCAEFGGINYGLWSQAVSQGKTAGANAAGDNKEYGAESPALNFHGMGTALFAAGDNGKNANLVYRTVELKDMGRKQYEKLYFLNNRLCGVILIGDVGRMAELTDALNRHASYRDVMR